MKTNQRGFTIVEMIIVATIVLLLGIIALVAATKLKDNPMSEKEYCDMYQYSAVKDLPVKCLNYYNVRGV